MTTSAIRTSFASGIVAAACLLACGAPAAAQFLDRLSNPKSTFTVVHQPQLSLKGVTKISVLEFTGDGSCGVELTERVTEMLSRSAKFEVIDRASIDAVLREQNFQASGAVSPETQTRLGALLGPAAVVTGRVTRCGVSRAPMVYSDYRDGSRMRRRYHARTVAIVSVSVSVIDLTTGKRHSGGLLTATDTLQNQAIDALPEYPSADAAKINVLGDVVRQASRLVLPWNEYVQVVVYDDNKCDLQRSAGQIKASDFAGAITTLRTAIGNQCGAPNDKNLLAKANYNLGVALTYSDQLGEALNALQAASALRSTSITNEAVAVVRQLQAAEADRRIAESSAVEMGVPSPASAGPPANALTNKEITDFIKAKLSDQVIIAQIRSTPCRFDMSPTALIALKNAGASDAVILEMTDASSKKCK